jgi:hypothetical protein
MLQVCVEQGHIRYLEELRSLLTWRFQTFPAAKEKAA